MAKPYIYAWSTLGKKIFAALSGLVLVSFLISHLLGNLLLFHPDPQKYNEYSHTLISLGWILIAVELVLLSFFGLHILTGVWVTLNNRAARSVKYEVENYAGSPSRKTISSRTMIWSGLVLLVFVIVHLVNFKYGSIPQTEDGMHDFHGMVMRFFKNPLNVVGYVAAMSFIFWHMRHGFWSAFQSLGVNSPLYSKWLYRAGLVLAIALVAGYLAIPIYIFIFVSI